jgi:uncharacterized protein YjeT (DUF2065 family)
MSLPALLDISEIQTRLAAVFPEGTPQRLYCIREMAARTVFVMLYVGAVEGAGTFMAPKQAYRMTDAQANKTDEKVRLKYVKDAQKANFAAAGKRWYADNSREPLRDETLRDGLVANGAVVIDASVPTTSGKGRYALQQGFAALFDPKLKADALVKAIEQWQEANLSHSALARTRLLRSGAAASSQKVRVKFPNGEARLMEPGPSSVIMKAVIEEFAPRFLRVPAVVWVSESGNKVVLKDDALARDLGLKIEKDKTLPDAILADLSAKRPILIFVEVVATDGPISEARRELLLKLATDAGFRAGDVYFVTAFTDRSASAFKKAISSLAWGSFAWCMAEPTHIIVLHGGTTAYLTSFHDLIQRPD